MEGWPAGSYQVQVLGETAEGGRLEKVRIPVIQLR
jgi:hypothetical protein